MDPQVISLAFNVVLGIAAFFAASVMKDLSAAIRELRTADKELHEKLSTLGRQAITHEELRDLRLEMREGFTRIHTRIDEITGKYVLKSECATCRDK